jgi:hypothetical protein
MTSPILGRLLGAAILIASRNADHVFLMAGFLSSLLYPVIFPSSKQSDEIHASGTALLLGGSEHSRTDFAYPIIGNSKSGRHPMSNEQGPAE